MSCLNCEDVSNGDQSPEECHGGERPKQTEVSPPGRIKVQHPKKTWLKKLLMEGPWGLWDLTLKVGAALPGSYGKSVQT